MRCPTCGTNTPGTLGRCSNCNAPIDLPAGPMGAPPPLAAPVPQDVGDRTMVVPPLTPSWNNEPPAPSDSASVSTAPWSIETDDEDDSHQVAAPPPPAWAARYDDPPRYDDLPRYNDPPRYQEPPRPEGERPESIVPDSWFRKPQEPKPQHDQTAVLGSAYAVGGPMPTQLDHPPMNVGHPMGQMGQMDPSLGPPMPPAYYPPPSSGGSGQASKPLLITVSALVVIALGTVALVLWPGGDDKPTAGPPTPSPSQSSPVAQNQSLSSPAKQQALQVNRLLNSSANTRRVLARAHNGTAKCQTLPAAIKGFQTVARHRSSQLNQANQLQVDKLRNGERMRTSLRQAFQASLDADLRLLAWANKARKGCKGAPRPSVAKAPGRTDAERRATLAKKQFVTMWNPVAKQAGMSPRVWNGL